MIGNEEIGVKNEREPIASIVEVVRVAIVGIEPEAIIIVVDVEDVKVAIRVGYV